MTERPNDKAIEAAVEATWDGFGTEETAREVARIHIEAAAPHIIEQFIDGLTDEFLDDLIVDEIYNSQAGLGRDFKGIRNELRGLIPK